MLKINRSQTKKDAKKDTYRLRYRIPVEIKKDMDVRVVEDGFGFRGKSKWITEAIKELFKDSSWLEQILSGDYATNNKSKEDFVVLENEMSLLINRKAQELIFHGLLQEPSTIIDGYLGAIVRTAIIKKLYMKGEPLNLSRLGENDNNGTKNDWELFLAYRKKYLKRNGIII